MTEAEKIATLIQCRLAQAKEALDAAELNLANGLHRSAVNRAYYAMFYAVLALLAPRRILGRFVRAASGPPPLARQRFQ